MIVTEPTTNEILQVAELARAFIDTEDQNTAIDEPISDGEREVVQRVHDWAEALEKLTPADTAMLATAAIQNTSEHHQIETCLTISTGHLSEDCATAMQMGADFNLVVYAKGDYGWWVFLGDLPADTSEIPPELLAAIAVAKEANCTWLCFDQAADLHPNLDSFEW